MNFVYMMMKTAAIKGMHQPSSCLAPCLIGAPAAAVCKEQRGAQGLPFIRKPSGFNLKQRMKS